MEIFSTWQFNLLAYLVSIVFFFQFNRIAVRQAQDDAAATLVLQTVAVVSVLVLVPFFPIAFPVKLAIWALLLLASVFYAFNDRLQTPVRKNLQVSVYSILGQLVFVFLFAYGIFVFKEPFALSKVLGVALIIAANVMIFFKRGELRLNRYAVMGLIAAFALATAIMIDVGASQSFNLPIYIALTLLIPGLFIMLAEKVSVPRIAAEYRHSDIRPTL